MRRKKEQNSHFSTYVVGANSDAIDAAVTAMDTVGASDAYPTSLMTGPVDTRPDPALLRLYQQVTGMTDGPIDTTVDVVEQGEEDQGELQ